MNMGKKLLNIIFGSILLYAFASCEKEDNLLTIPSFPEVESPSPQEPNDEDDELVNEVPDQNQTNQDSDSLENEGNENPKEEGDDDENGESSSGADDKNQDIEDKEPEFYGYEYTILPDQIMADGINNRNWYYDMLLPPSYNFEKERDYPVLFLLHPYDLNCTCWLNDFGLKEKVEMSLSSGLIPEMIIVMPFAYNTYYIDGFLDGIKYETFFMQEFLPAITEKYRISSRREDRYIGGASMGGYGAARYATRYPMEFGFCFSMSAPIDGKGKSAQLEAVFTQEVLENSENLPYFVFDIGNRDSFLKANQNIDNLLTEYHIPHELIVRSGNHNSQFWMESISNLLDRLSKFIRH